MPRVFVPFPIGGISENFAFDDQPPKTSRDMRNTRGLDPRTDRLRGASRGGLTRFCPTPVGTGPIKYANQIVYEAANLTYGDTASAATTVWSDATPTNGDVKGQDSDAQNNVYVTDGAVGIAKFNSSGAQIWKIALPAKDKDHQCTAIRVQKSTRLVFAGISNGGPSDTASLFCYQQQDDNATKLLWQIQPGGYIKQLRFYGENLYCLLNFPDRNRSYVRVYDTLLSTAPVQQKEWEVPSNGNDFDVSPVDGSVFVASGADAQRGLDPRSPGSTVRSIDWTPQANLANWKTRAWSWFDASDRDSLQIEPLPQGGDEGGEVVGWIDKTGNGRSWYANHEISAYPAVPATEAGPTYKSVGVGGLPGISFSGQVYNGFGAGAISGRSMVGQGASSTDRAYRTEQLSPIPTYKGAQFALFMVIKAGIDDTNIRGLLSIPLAGNNVGSKILSINRRDDNNLPGTIPIPGSISLRDPGAKRSDAGASTPQAEGPSGPNSVSCGSLSGSGVAVLTWICDGGVHDGNTANGQQGFSTRSVFRVNGHVCDRWQSVPFNTSEAITLGLAYLGSSGHSRFAGLVCEMICLSDWYDQNGNQQQLVSCPAYPDIGWQPMNDAATISTYHYNPGNTEVEKIEGYLAHKWGFAHELETGQAAFMNFRQPDNNETLTIDGITYRFVTTLSQPNDVQINLSHFENTAGNLYQAINRIGNPGVDYDQRTQKHPTYMAFAPVYADSVLNMRIGIRSISPYAPQLSLAASSAGHIFWNAGQTSLHFGALGNAQQWYPHPYALRKTTNSKGGPPADGVNLVADVSNSYLLQSQYPQLTKWSPNSGKPRWAATSGFDVLASGTLVVTTNASGLGGVGRAVRIGSKGQAFSVGDQQTTVAGSEIINQDLVDIRKLYDLGDSFALTGSQPWETAVLTGQTGWEINLIGCDVDAFDNFYVPVFFSGTGALAGVSLLGYRSTAGAANAAIEFMREATLAAHQRAYAVSVDQSKLDFPTGDTIQHSAYAYVGVRRDPGDTANLALFKLQLVSFTGAEGAVRSTATVAVAAGSLYLVSSTGSTLVGSGLDPAAQYVDGAIVLGKLFLADGRGMFVYDPKANTLSPYRPTSSGEFLPTCKLLSVFNGRLVGARPADNGHNWFMSKQGDPFNCDIFPFTVTEAEAVEGAGSRTGANPDIINGFFQIRDDLAIVLCDHGVYRFTGDPMAGGSFHPITTITGGSFGRSGAMDPYGAFYFFSSRGGVFRMAPDGVQIDSLTISKISRRLETLDLGTYRVEFQWGTEEDGLHVFVVPYGNGGTHVEHYFWERQTNAWHADHFGNDTFTNIQPTTSCIIDGDLPHDRKVLVGCEDGYLRFYDEQAVNDDGFPIDSFALIGPIVPDNEGNEYLFTDFEIVVDRTQQAPNWSLYASDTANDPGDVIYHGELRPGRNKILARVRGAAVWLGIGSADVNGCWAVESIAARAEPMGVTRALS